MTVPIDRRRYRLGAIMVIIGIIGSMPAIPQPVLITAMAGGNIDGPKPLFRHNLAKGARPWRTTNPKSASPIETEST
jgi:hypothetical protein